MTNTTAKNGRPIGMPMAIEQWPIDQVIPYGKNPRIISEAAISKVAASIQEFGWRQPIVVDAKGVIIVGHTRHAAARSLGLDSVPVLVATDLTPAQAKAYRIADNRTGQETTWADDILAVELADLTALDFDLTLTGFSKLDLDALFGDPVDDPAEEWQGMPEYEHQEQESAYQLIVHFANADDLLAFSNLVGQTNINEKTKSIWYPKMERAQFADKRYVAVSGEDPDAA